MTRSEVIPVVVCQIFHSFAGWLNQCSHFCVCSNLLLVHCVSPRCNRYFFCAAIGLHYTILGYVLYRSNVHLAVSYWHNDLDVAIKYIECYYAGQT